MTAAIVVVVAIVVAGLVDQIVNSYQPANARSVRSWESAAAPIIAESNSLGALLRATPGALAGYDRAALDGTIDALQGGTTAEAANVEVLGIAPPSAKAAQLLRATLADRAAAVVSFAAGVSSATGPSHDVRAAELSFGAATADLARGDAAYRALLVALGPQKGVLPASAWLQPPSPFGSDFASHLAGELARSPRLAELSRLAIVAISLQPAPDHITGLPSATTTTTVVVTTTVPRTTSTTSTTLALGSTSTSSTTTSVVTTTTVPPTTTTLQVPPSGSRSYLLPTPSVTVTVVVRNAGDVTVGDVSVQVSLLPTATVSGPPSAEAMARLGTLGLGRSVAVSLGPLAISRRVASYRLQVVVTGDGVSPASDTVDIVPSH